MLTPLEILTLLERIEKINGGRMEIWLNIRDIAHAIVERFKLSPLSDETVATYAHTMVGGVGEVGEMSERVAPQTMQSVKAMPSEAIRKNFWIDPRGGMKSPHLHLDGKIFMLEGEVYREFSKQLINNIQKRVSAAGAIQFNQLLKVSEASIGL